MAEQSDLFVWAQQLRESLNRYRGTQYPEDLHKQVVAYWNEAKCQGVSTQGVLKALGINLTSLKRWRRAALRAKQSSGVRPVEIVPCIRPVEVVSEPCQQASPAAQRPIVYTSSGLRIEGLDIKSLAELIRSCR